MEPKRRLLELLLSSDAPSWRVRRIVVEEHGRDEESTEQESTVVGLRRAVLQARSFEMFATPAVDSPAANAGERAAIIFEARLRKMSADRDLVAVKHNR